MYIQGVSQKIKTADVFLKLGNLASIYQRQPPWLKKRHFFWYNPKPKESWKTPFLEKIFQGMTLCNTHKSPLINTFVLK